MIKELFAMTVCAFSVAQFANAAESTAQKIPQIDVDPMKGCYAADRFYSAGMLLETASGTMICDHSKDDWGHRTNSTPFEWVKKD